MYGSTWKKEETLKLLEIWGNEAVQSQLVGLKSSVEVFEQISVDLRGFGYDKTGQQCNNKVKKLKCEYKKAKDHKGSKKDKLGDDPKMWEYFNIIDNVLNHKLPILPCVESAPDGDNQEVDNNLSGYIREVADSLSQNIQEVNGSAQPAAGSCSVPPFELYQKTMLAGNAATTSRKRERQESGELVAILGGLVEKVVEAKLKCDMKIVEIEEKRIKLEEKRLESDARMRQEEREFQLKMLQCMVDSRLCQPDKSLTLPSHSSVEDIPSNSSQL